MAYGVIVINKDTDISSQGVVNRVKRLFGESKAGHTGTLDPLATGVLPVLLGRAVKASEFMLSSDKYYKAGLTLGLTSDTEDITGKILTRHTGAMPSESKVREAISGFVGDITQIPPMYSALKVGGKKLCDLARDGITVEREPRKITVFSIDVERVDDSRYNLDVHCTGGTYIRTLCSDIGASLGVGGLMHALHRTHASVFTDSDSYTLSELEAMTEDERMSKIIPIERVFEKYQRVCLSPFFERLAKNGLEIYLKKIGLSLPTGTLVRLSSSEGEFFAVGEVMDYPDGTAIKPIRQFAL